MGVIDMDPQANTTSVLLGNMPMPDIETIGAILDPNFNKPISTLFQPSNKFDNIDVLPSTIKLAAVWPRVYTRVHEYMTNIFTLLADNIDADRAKINESYDFIFIDTPPSLDLPSVNAISASDYVIIPIQSGDSFSLDGWIELESNIRRVQQRINPNLQIMGILITFYDPRFNVCRTTTQFVHDKFKKLNIRVFKTIISASVEVKSAQIKRSTINIVRSNHKISKQYEQVADEILSIIKSENR